MLGMLAAPDHMSEFFQRTALLRAGQGSRSGGRSQFGFFRAQLVHVVLGLEAGLIGAREAR